MYHCVGGPAEVLDGGLHSEGAPSAKMEIPDAVVERRLLRAVAACDLVLTMGTKAVNFFQSRGVRAHFHVVSACIDFERFTPAHSPPCYDLIFVGRLAEIKCIDILLRAVKSERAVIAAVEKFSVQPLSEGPMKSKAAAQPSSFATWRMLLP